MFKELVMVSGSRYWAVLLAVFRAGAPPHSEKFLEYHDFNIVRKCKDTLETFINEGMLLCINKPKLNNMQRNSFTE